jgi:hypothetical protein
MKPPHIRRQGRPLGMRMSIQIRAAAFRSK